MEEEHLRLIDTLRDRFLNDLAALDVDVIDLRETFERSAELLYWKHDSHINLRAHELIAETLRPWLAARLVK